MAHGGCSSTPLATKPDEPFGDLLHVNLFNEEPFGRFQPYFSRKYPNLAPMKVVLIDPLGNVNTVTVEKIGAQYYFTDGRHHFGVFHGILKSAMVRLVYVHSKTFNFTIRDYKGVEWIYPPIPGSLVAGHDANFVPPQFHGYELLIPNRDEFMFQTVPWHSFSAFTNDIIVISDAFAIHALPKEDGYMCIVDECRKRWPCQVQHRDCKIEKHVINRGWARFCRYKGLFKNQKIMFAVTEAHSNKLFYLPMD